VSIKVEVIEIHPRFFCMKTKCDRGYTCINPSSSPLGQVCSSLILQETLRKVIEEVKA